MKKYIIAITGASGVIYGVRLIENLLKTECSIYVVVSDPGKAVIEDELGIPFYNDINIFKQNFLNHFSNSNKIHYLDVSDMKASIASGSFKTDSMVIIPCTMSTLSAIANGSSKNLIERAADVTLKEGRQLILVPRETPLNTIHLKNMLFLSQCGVKILPPMPAFYNKPVTIDDMVNFIVGKVLDLMGIENNLYNRWTETK